MTKIRFDSKVSAAAGDALATLSRPLYARLGARRLAVIELASVERSEMAEDEDKEPAVKVRVAQLETANEDQEDILRQALRALKLHRTASGTLTEDGDVELSASTLERTGGQLHAVEAARLRTGLQHWLDYTRQVLRTVNPSATELRHELDTAAAGLAQLLHEPDQEDS